MREYVGRQYAGIALHRRRTVIVRMTEDGQRLDTAVRADNDRSELARQIWTWGPIPEVVLEATRATRARFASSQVGSVLDRCQAGVGYVRGFNANEKLVCLICRG